MCPIIAIKPAKGRTTMQCIEIATNQCKQKYDKVSAEYESWKAKGLKLAALEQVYRF